MTINRRGFLKVLGVTGAALAVGRDLKAAPNSNTEIDFRGVLYDSARCKGCHGCEYDCADANGLPPPDPAKDLPLVRQTSETKRTVVNQYNTSKGKVFLKMQCCLLYTSPSPRDS